MPLALPRAVDGKLTQQGHQKAIRPITLLRFRKK